MKLIKKLQSLQEGYGFFWAVLVLCLLILGESIWVMGKFTDKNSSGQQTIKPPAIINRQPVSEPEVAVYLEGEAELTQNKLSTLVLGIEGIKEMEVAGVDLVINYDPKTIQLIDSDSEVAGIQVNTEETKFGKAARNLVEEDRGRIVLSFVNLDEEPQIAKGEKTILAEISFLPLTKGKASVSLKKTTENSPGTKVIDNKTLEEVEVETKNYSVEVK
jgi:hypothetical protein